MDGKAMVVCMSRRICVDLYREIIKLRPRWHSEDDERGSITIVMTGSASDPLDWQPHIRSKARRESLATRFKDPNDPLKLVIVRDMWLTGFDAPCVHTMYMDKPMRGHGLMQAIARVNRVFRDKSGGLVVDYLGLADQLRSALATYTEAGGKGTTAIDQNESVSVMLAKFEVCQAMFHGLDYHHVRGNPKVLFNFLPAAQEHILKQDDGKDRFVHAVTELSRAFALAVPHDDALRIRDEAAFFQAVKAALVQKTVGDTKPQDLDHAIRQIVSLAPRHDQALRRGTHLVRTSVPPDRHTLNKVVSGRYGQQHSDHAGNVPRRAPHPEAPSTRLGTSLSSADSHCSSRAAYDSSPVSPST
jgi:type I restriction enzyme, R subunit